MEPTNGKVRTINDALREMKAAFDKRKADPDTILIELTSYAASQLEKNPELKRDHVFSAYKGQIEKRLLSREEPRS